MFSSNPFFKIFTEYICNISLILAKFFSKKQDELPVTMLEGNKRRIEILSKELGLDDPKEIACNEGSDNDLNSDSRKLRRLQILNSKLISDLADAKLSEERSLQDYKNEREQRKKLEEICDQMAKMLDENTKKVEHLCKESESLSEKFKNEVVMVRATAKIQVCGMQLKLDDARLLMESKYKELNDAGLLIESKYNELDDLQSQLESFVRKNCGSHDAIEAVTEAKDLVEAVNEAKVKCEDDLMQMSTVPQVGASDIIGQ